MYVVDTQRLEMLVGELTTGQQLTDCDSFALGYADTDKRTVWQLDKARPKGH